MDMQSLLGVLAVTVNPAVGNAEMQQAERQLNQVLYSAAHIRSFQPAHRQTRITR